MNIFIAKIENLLTLEKNEIISIRSLSDSWVNQSKFFLLLNLTNDSTPIDPFPL